MKLGDKARDVVTGFEGVIVAVTDWLHGCRRMTLQPVKLTKDGRIAERETFDEPQLVLVKAAAVPVGNPRTGGPMPNPPDKRTNDRRRTRKGEAVE